LEHHQEIETSNQPLTLVIFGGTGDLTHRKLLPALYHLMADERLPEETAILAIGRRGMDSEDYRLQARASIAQFSRTGVEEERLNRFTRQLYYHRMEFVSEPDSYEGLREVLREKEAGFSAPAVRLFFLAVAPEFFGPIVEQLGQRGLAERGNLSHRVMIEKPFGSDLETARAIIARPWNTIIFAVFLVTMFWHARLGLQIVIEDYVHRRWLEIAAHFLNHFLCGLGAVASLYAIARIAFAS